MPNQKTYKAYPISNISNLRIVSMSPSDSQELLDDYHFSINLGGFECKIL